MPHARPRTPPSLALRCAAILVVALAGGCGQSETAARRGAREQVLHVPNQAEPADLDPQTITGNIESNIVPSLIEGLVTLDMRTLDVRPGAAASWSVSGDGRTHTFHLQPEGRWSNGALVTAHDFVASYRRMLTPALGASYAYMLFVVEGAEDYWRGNRADFSTVGFRAADDRTLEIRLRHAVPFFLPMLAHHSWFPVHVPTVETHGGMARRGTAWTRAEHYVGNGAFRLKEWRPDRVIVLEASPTYWNRAGVKLREVRFHSVDSIDAQERMFRAGQLHRTDTLAASKIDVYRRERPEVLSMAPYCATSFLRLNVTRPPLNDVRVRRALSLAIDRESLVRHVLRGGQQPAWHFTPPATAGFTAECRTGYDPGEARGQLAAAGFPGGRGFPEIEFSFNTHEMNRVVAEALQEMWKRQLGIPVRLVNRELKVFLAEIETGAFQIARATWYADYVDPHNFLELWVGGAGNNFTGWRNEKYDRLLRGALAAPSQSTRFATYQELERILAREVPVIPVFFATQVRLVSPALQGWHPNHCGYVSYKDCSLRKP